ncbi:MAG: hypothetical protein KAX39_06280 [candidate division Zixibacteria bacterium]|nr:hypothetical protein [candidate division Zixibacteria bacterium]
MTFTKKSFGFMISLFFLLSCLFQVPQADVSYKQKTISSGTLAFGGTETQTTVMLKSDRQKMVTQTKFTGKLSKFMAKGGTKSVQITRLDKELTWNIDPDRKKYTEISFEEMKKMFEEMEKAVQEAESLKTEKETVPEPKVEVYVTGKKKKISGYPCEQAIIKMTVEGEDEKSGKNQTFIITNEMWLTKDFPAQKEIKEFENKMSQKLGMKQGYGQDMFSAFTQFGIDVNKLTEEMKKIEGFPILQTITMEVKGEKIEAEMESSVEEEEEDEDDMEEEALKGLAKGLFGKKEKGGKEERNIILSITTEVTEVKTGKINDSEFELPSGLEKETKK